MKSFNNSKGKRGYSSTLQQVGSSKNGHQQHKKRKISPEALELSSKLKFFSVNKQVEEALELYRNTPSHICDGHHLAILVDCCARCGTMENAEQLIQQYQKKSSNTSLSVQCQTALLKGYAHAGNMEKATSLFDSMIRTTKQKSYSGPNVRTLNTLLRGCMWTAATVSTNTAMVGDDSLGIVGGVVSCRKALRSISSQKELAMDESSYEYSIVMLCQALQCSEAQQMLQTYHSSNLPDESLAVVFVALSRAYALLGNVHDALQYAEQALKSIQQAYSSQKEQPSTTSSPFGEEKKQPTITAGGKRSWKQKGNNNDGDDSSGYTAHLPSNNNRREESNLLFRKHRLTELKAEAQIIQSMCKNDPDRIQSYDGIVAKMLLSKLLYFSGGGTTTHQSEAQQQNQRQQLKEQLLIPLWFSFGLAASVHRPINDTSMVFSKKDKKALHKFCNHHQPLEKSIDTNGHIHFESIFASPIAEVKEPSREIHLELGAGSGDWIVTQARCNPKDWYVSVELRADRVAQTFAKCLLADQKIVENVCVIGAEAGSLLRQHIQPKSISTIFINHPEPPTQTYGTTNTDHQSLLSSIQTNEPAHMLQSSTLIEIGKCLKPNGKGRLVIVTDNRWYARLICVTLQKAILSYSSNLKKDTECLFSSYNPNDGMKNYNNKRLHPVETFHSPSQSRNNQSKKTTCNIVMYEGKPSELIGHYVPSSDTNNGSSYFDRLWMSGAGKHAEMKKRFIIVMQSYNQHSSTSSTTIHSQQPNIKKVGNKKNKKRSQAKQEKRNQMRLERKRLAEATKASQTVSENEN